MTAEERDFICYDCPHHGRSIECEPCLTCANGAGKHPVDYWEKISEIAAKQRAKGISTYGQPLEWNNLPDVMERLTMLQEELVDGLMYLEWIKTKLKEGNNEG